MIKVLHQAMTNSYDTSLKIKVTEYPTLEDFKNEVLAHYPMVSISLPDDDKDFWFGIQYGCTSNGYWFRWLYAIMDTERGCLYSNGDFDCEKHLGLPQGVQHCSKEVHKMLQDIKNEVENRKNNIVFVE